MCEKQNKKGSASCGVKCPFIDYGFTPRRIQGKVRHGKNVLPIRNVMVMTTAVLPVYEIAKTHQMLDEKLFKEWMK
jgi:hypothetical protein